MRHYILGKNAYVLHTALCVICVTFGVTYVRFTFYGKLHNHSTFIPVRAYALFKSHTLPTLPHRE